MIIIIKDFEELQLNLHKQVDDDEEKENKLLVGRGKTAHAQHKRHPVLKGG